mgnify:CR=1 FL=1
MKFGKVDINTNDMDWSEVTWKEFLVAYDLSLAGIVTETPEEIGRAIGVKVPKEKVPKGGDA